MRVSCPDHGVHQVELSWAQTGSRFNHLFEALAVGLLLATNVSRAAKTLRISWGEAWQLIERSVKRGRAVKGSDTLSQIDVDENVIAKRHRCITLLCDLEASTVEYIGEGRSEDILTGYFEGLIDIVSGTCFLARQE